MKHVISCMNLGVMEKVRAMRNVIWQKKIILRGNGKVS